MRSQSGTHLNFDGVDDYVELPNETTFDFTNQMTIEFWMNSSIMPEQWDAIVAKGDYSWRVALASDGTIAFTGTGAFTDFFSTTVVTDGNWHHVAVTYDGINAIIYIDGVVENSSEATADINNSNYNVAIGENLEATGRYYSGNLEDVRIWNVARTEAQINASKNCELQGSETGLVAYYKFNQGLDAQDNSGVLTLTDATANANNGTLTNFDLISGTSNWISGSPIVSGLICCPNATTWDGFSWTNGTPDATKLAIFSGDYTGNGFNACSVQVTGTANVIINSNQNLEIQNDVHIASGASFILENNTNLVQVNNGVNSGNAVVKRNSNALKRLDYTLWSSPVSGTQTMADFSPLTSQTPTSRFYIYDNTQGTTGLYSSVSPTTTFAKATGYLIRMPNTDPTSGYDDGTSTLAYPGAFTGTLNNGTVTLGSLTPLTSDKYYAVGNPYPSTIGAQLFLDGNSTDGVLYFWRKTNAALGSAYATFTSGGATTTTPSSAAPDGTIAVGQGFIVKTGVAATTLNFTNAMRTNNNNAQFFKTKKVAQKDRVWLNLTNSKGVFSQALVVYAADATLGLDKYDGKYINDSSIALTSEINNEEYVIQGRPAFDATDVVDLNFKTVQVGDYTIAIDHTEGVFAAGQDVYLVDSKTGTETNLKTSAYTFTAAAGVDNARFSLKYQKTLKVDAPTFNDNSVRVYKNKGTLYVNSDSSAISNIKVFDIQGKLIAEQKNVKANSASISNLKAIREVLIVRVVSEDNKTVSKKVVN
jgi:hypothetical protein